MPVTTWGRGRTTALAVLALAGVCLGVGCAKATVDASPIIQPVTKQLNDVGITVRSMDCPSDVVAATGATFRCTVSTEGPDTIGVLVTQHDDGGRPKLDWEIGHELVATQKLLADLTAYAKTVSPDLSVTCPRAVVVPNGNGKLRCEVKDTAGQGGTLVVPIADGAPVADRAQWSIEQG